MRRIFPPKSQDGHVWRQLPMTNRPGMTNGLKRAKTIQLIGLECMNCKARISFGPGYGFYISGAYDWKFPTCAEEKVRQVMES